MYIEWKAGNAPTDDLYKLAHTHTEHKKQEKKSSTQLDDGGGGDDGGGDDGSAYVIS